ncbi:MAG: hypothetical protein JST19_21450 [Bacteroidetes bacterium]|nr:hypothetical protein [Bacteroidota bacterium]
MKTIQLNLYSFDELDEKGKQNALQEFQDLNVMFDWWEFSYNDFESICTCLGITVDNKSIHFQGFYSQGDGSCFDADVDLLALINAIAVSAWKDYAPNVEFQFSVPGIDRRVLTLIQKKKIEINARIISRQRGYGIVIDLGVYPVSETGKNHDMIYGELDELEKWLDGIAQTLNRYLYKSLEREYEYQTGDEAIAGSIEANDYLFTSDGKSATRLNKLANNQ